MRLYDSAISGNCYKVRLMLAHLGIPFERVPVDVTSREDRRRTLGDKNPILRIPILELDGGRCLAESNAILWHLAEGTAYIPADSMERNRVLQWLFFEQNNHEPNIAVARKWIQVLGKEKEFADHLVLKREGGHGALSIMDRHLKDHPFFVDDRYSIADIALYAYTHVAPEGGFDLAGYPSIRAWLARVVEQTGHVRMMDGANA
ncbi:MAG: glutathione S-transferase family protein [Acidobacteria bacterium]|nr:glutathione S-transferase family protein [Acidobacteriota bacterium]